MTGVAALFLLLALATVATAADRPRVPNGIKPLSKEMINFINSINTTWKAGQTFSPDFPMENIPGLLGVRRMFVANPSKVFDDKVDIPKSFDSRTKWPD